MSGIVKAGKKLVEGVKNVGKKIFKGVKKAFEWVTDNPLQTLMLGAAIFTGGAALGYWQSPWASINGAWTAAGSQASQAAATAGATAPAAGAAAGAAPGAVSAAAPAVAATPTATAAPAATGGIDAVAGGWKAAEGVAAGAGGAGTAAAGTANPILSAVGKGAGIIGRSIKGLAGFAQENPIMAAMGINALASAYAEDPVQEAEKRRQNRLRRHFALEDNMGAPTPSGDPTLYDTQGNPVYAGGIIGRRQRG